jgi:hypothetical protein
VTEVPESKVGVTGVIASPIVTLNTLGVYKGFVGGDGLTVIDSPTDVDPDGLVPVIV